MIPAVSPELIADERTPIADAIWIAVTARRIVRAGLAAHLPRFRYRCGDCRRFIRASTVLEFFDDEAGVTDASGECSQCGYVDVTREAAA